MPMELQEKVSGLLDQFMAITASISEKRKLQRAVVRSLLPCSLIALLDRSNLFVLAQRHFGMPSSMFIHLPERELTTQKALTAARWEFGFEDPFIVVFPRQLLDKEEAKRQKDLEAIALAHVESEFQRMIKMTSLVQISPIFGPASYSVDDKLAFVLMPFEDDLTRIYREIIKPAVESMGLVCKRADEIRSNKAIVQDIWKAICEARVVIADITASNPNVMYELGIAHTVGKETIIIYQVGKRGHAKLPFDLAHIRRIEYKDTAAGGKKLERELCATLEVVLSPVAVS